MSEQSNSQRARAAFRAQAARVREENRKTRAQSYQQMHQQTYQHSWQELVRAGFWLSVGAVIVFPLVMLVLGAVALVIFSSF